MIGVIDCETTGLIPYFHEAIDISILPLTDTFEPHEGIEPFYVEIKPQFPERAEARALKVNGHTMDELMQRTITRESAVNMFTEWFSRCVPRHQKVEPLAQNWSFDRSFLTATFQGLNLDNYIFYRARDIQRVIEFINDRARIHGARVPFSSSALVKVAQALGIENKNPHSAMCDCYTTAAVYRTLCLR